MPTDSEKDDKPRARGLPSIQQAREGRAEGKTRWPAPKFFAFAGLVLVVGGILRWKWFDAEVERTKSKLLADQRGVAAELKPRWLPLRDRIEGWVTGLANDPGPEVIDREALSKWDFRTQAGLYLRLRVEEAQSAEDIRNGARNSLRDGFTSCLQFPGNPDPTAGTKCTRSRDCPAREFCNEQDHCSRPAQPFNLRVAYSTMQILTDEWVRNVQDADSELRTRLYVTNFEDAIRSDLPLAAELLQKAQYLLVVLDETPKGLTPPAPKKPGDDVGEALTEAVLSVPHVARVALFRLSDGKVPLRIRRESGSGSDLMGVPPDADPKVIAALQRQANRCDLALSVRKALGDPGVDATPPR
jgi:hypothetical protein